MEFIDVSSHKGELIIKRPVYFSRNLLNYIESEKSDIDDPILSILMAIPLGIWAQRIEESATQVIIFILKGILVKTNEIFVFSGELNNEICLICIKIDEVKNFYPIVNFFEYDPLKVFSKKDEILLLNPFVKKNKIRLKSFFIEEQVMQIVIAFKNNCSASLN